MMIVTGVPKCGTTAVHSYLTGEGYDVGHEIDVGEDGLVSSKHFHPVHWHFDPDHIIHLRREPARHLWSFDQSDLIHSQFFNDQYRRAFGVNPSLVIEAYCTIAGFLDEICDDTWWIEDLDISNLHSSKISYPYKKHLTDL